MNETFEGNRIGQCQCVHIFLRCCLCLRTQKGTENPRDHKSVSSHWSINELILYSTNSPQRVVYLPVGLEGG
jgi:hypothetical protein